MNTQLTNAVEAVILTKMQSGESFTALDVSNAIKAAQLPFRHREVSAVVREIYDSGAMAYFDFERALIPVWTEGGAKAAEAYLYHPENVNPLDYTTRSQDALPPVASTQARDLTGTTAQDMLALFAASQETD
jgi:hypothetical protein